DRARSGAAFRPYKLWSRLEPPLCAHSSLCSVSTLCWRSSPFTDDSAIALLESSADDLDLLFSSPNHFPLRTLHSIVVFSRRLLESSGLACDSVHRVAQFPRGGRCRWDMCNTGAGTWKWWDTRVHLGRW
ncbi:hypothetical protein DNTS_005917, partial [Danionella cerebrum]